MAHTSAKGRSGAVVSDDNPHVTLMHRGIDIMIFFLATPVAIWLALSFVVPFLANLGHGADRVVDYLRRVQTFELAQAKIATPAFTIRGHELIEEAWPYHSAVNLVRHVVPNADEGAFIERADGEAARREDLSTAAGEPAASGAIANPVVRHLTQEANSWLQDRFWPIQAAWGVMVITRAWYALQLLFLAFGAILIGFFVGEYQSRVRAKAGIMPMANRFAGWLHVIKYALATIPGFCALPIPLPTLPTLLVLYAILVIAVIRTRAHFTEF